MLISFENAYGIIIDSVKTLKSEKISFSESLNRILAEDVVSDINMPPFNKSAMDGYACRKNNLKNELAVIETIPAGFVPQKKIKKNECSKIMTGAMVPHGADCVIMIEHTKKNNSNRIIFTENKKIKKNENICRKSEDIKKGDTVLKKGIIIKSQHIAILSTVGCTTPLVYCRPKVGIITTGNELIEPSQYPSGSQIRNSNGHQLISQVTSVNAIPNYYGILDDKKDSLAAVIKKAKNENDIIILSGGVSMGDFDLVPHSLEDNDFELLIRKVAIKPGKPIVFGNNNTDKCFCFGLPGNPISVFVSFELFVKPFLYKIMGHEYKTRRIKLTMGKGITRKKTDRRAWIPVKISESGRLITIPYHGSAHINSLCFADGLITIPVGVSKIKAGSLIDIRLI